MSKIIGYRLLLIPRKQTRRLCRDSEHAVALSLAEQVIWGFCSIKPLRTHLHSRQNFFPPFHASGYPYVDLREIPPSPLGISNRATRKASAQCRVTALFLRWPAPVGNKCLLIRALVARSFLTWKTLFSLLSRSKPVVWSVCNLMGALSSQWSSLNTLLSHLSRSVQWERITAARSASP